MDHDGMDVHEEESLLYIRRDHRAAIRTQPERLAAVLGARPRARILIEASADSETRAHCLEALGHEDTDRDWTPFAILNVLLQTTGPQDGAGRSPHHHLEVGAARAQRVCEHLVPG